jgi:hypothetical protein
MKLTPKDLDGINALRLEHYNQRAANFFAGTSDHDVSQNIASAAGAHRGNDRQFNLGTFLARRVEGSGLKLILRLRKSRP